MKNFLVFWMFINSPKQVKKKLWQTVGLQMFYYSNHHDYLKRYEVSVIYLILAPLYN